MVIGLLSGVQRCKVQFIVYGGVWNAIMSQSGVQWGVGGQTVHLAA